MSAGGRDLAEGRLQGKVAIVTGAGHDGSEFGIAASIASLFARHGASVVVADVDEERMRATVEKVEGDGGVALGVVTDVTDVDHCAETVRAATGAFGRLDILVNNVGIACPGSVTTTSDESWSRALDVNLTSVLYMARYALPEIASGGGGVIINIASIAALRSMHSVAYAAAKGGMLALTRDMAVQHAPDGVRVNAIAPGHVRTPLVRASTEDRQAEEVSAQRARATPLGREGTTWDVAWAAVYLASDEASWVTGVTLPVDGGVLCAAPLSLTIGRFG